ncbi:MAG: sortase, partial [Acidobacteriota bacterium]|nr:sortase [Acidobacteriota bacterium]
MREGSGQGSSNLGRRLRRLEWLCLGLGAALVLLFAGARLHSAVSQQLQLAAFDQARAAQNGAGAAASTDQALWSEARIAKYNETLSQAFAPPLAVLRIPKIGLEVPVLAGTDDLTLNRAVGAIAGTALPGEVGNVGIAGHRDS